MYLDSLKELTDPATITTDVTFPPMYDDAIKWNLAVRLAPEYGKEASPTTKDLAISTLDAIETRNFAEQIIAASLELLKLYTKFNIDSV